MQQFNVVISGFDHYDGIEVNPSAEVARTLSSHGIDDMPDGTSATVTSVLLPLSFQNAWPTLRETIDAVHPDIVIATGLKTRSHSVALERCATNLIDASRPDVDNVQPRRTPINPEGSAAYWTRLPLRAILHDFTKRNIPATLSSDAGTFVCNSLFYQLLDWNAAQTNTLAGFMSFPKVGDGGKYGSGLSLDQMILAAQDAVRATVDYAVHPFADEICAD
ncbi:pyroglutamyl-peptidase I [Bifidobacterium sp. 82T24]|uniref:pyroglutamyl-peptidase I n=1 Tax=Bifidobacterium pluvialisilvae TaxID=2834436 RepID=UPI001C55EACE|nr:pyroglutamyl-peptidase I [Bifidobacterium pluvialisilvae]MBW3088934.1 pyroglutamyl-peptidase I [Bifidobacterium pluvialisilvae]